MQVILSEQFCAGSGVEQKCSRKGSPRSQMRMMVHRHIPAEAGLSSHQLFISSASRSRLTQPRLVYYPSRALLLSVSLLLLWKQSAPAYGWPAWCVRAAACVRACAFECVRGSAWHKPSSSDIHINPHTTSAPPLLLKVQ